MRPFLILFLGIFIGIWTSWPGVVIPENWRCFYKIISRSAEDKISLKAALSISPNYLISGNKKDKASKIRIVSDACFR